MPGSEIATAAGSADPRTGLRAAAALHRLADLVEAAQVSHARRLGWSWAEIAEVLGVSKQAVHQKHGPTDPGR